MKTIFSKTAFWFFILIILPTGASWEELASYTPQLGSVEVERQALDCQAIHRDLASMEEVFSTQINRRLKNNTNNIVVGAVSVLIQQGEEKCWETSYVGLEQDTVTIFESSSERKKDQTIKYYSSLQARELQGRNQELEEIHMGSRNFNRFFSREDTTLSEDIFFQRYSPFSKYIEKLRSGEILSSSDEEDEVSKSSLQLKEASTVWSRLIHDIWHSEQRLIYKLFYSDEEASEGSVSADSMFEEAGQSQNFLNTIFNTFEDEDEEKRIHALILHVHSRLDFCPMCRYTFAKHFYELLGYQYPEEVSRLKVGVLGSYRMPYDAPDDGFPREHREMERIEGSSFIWRLPFYITKIESSDGASGSS